MRLLTIFLILCAVTGCKSKSDQARIAERQPEPNALIHPDTTAAMPLDTAKSPPRDEVKPPIADKEKPQAAAAVGNPITNKRWKLVELHGDSVQVTKAFSSDPYITLSMHSNKLTGSGGCNRFGCKYKINGDRILLDQFAATKKLCADVMPIEDVFLRDLALVNSYKIDGDTMWLIKDGKRVMKFTALYL